MTILVTHSDSNAGSCLSLVLLCPLYLTNSLRSTGIMVYFMWWVTVCGAEQLLRENWDTNWGLSAGRCIGWERGKLAEGCSHLSLRDIINLWKNDGGFYGLFPLADDRWDHGFTGMVSIQSLSVVEALDGSETACNCWLELYRIQ